MKKSKKIILSSSAFAALTISVLANSCSVETQNSKVKNDSVEQMLSDPLLAQKWDSELKIYQRYYNPLFDLIKQKDFANQLQDKYNEIKNSFQELKNLPDVIIDFATAKTNEAILQLNSNNTEYDFSAVPYYSIINEYKNNELSAKPVIQTKTLKFVWSENDDLVYKDGTENDPLRKIAQKINDQYSGVIINGTQREFKNWDINRDKDLLEFDGSKFNRFYNKNNETTYVYRGAILISGDKNLIDQITDAWNKKDWDRFLSYGLVFRNYKSGGDYKYQISLISQHFNISIEQINKQLSQNAKDKSNFIIEDVPTQLGKTINYLGQKKLDRSFNIGFDAEGSLNWTLPGQQAKFFSPDNDAVVRVLSVTNPAPYDVMLARSGMLDIQAYILKKALQSFSVEENLYGLYTGYNAFADIDQNLFESFIKMQQAAEGVEGFSYSDVKFPKDNE
ncbi:hypothetical protein V2E24_00675 [Mycoplasmopsis ciconiae]|uniref:High affinity transport system protein n=1 Tax=Mycoplasmopsis ciconiae TaxID=561067 RepID=A0ABU7MKN3_9BACT|nr:hypothetical protein [Mycoplasmopsis ciconiae]